MLIQAIVWRDNKEWRQRFAYGRALDPMEAHPVATSMTGTRIRFKYDSGIFSPDAVFDTDVIRKRLRELAFLNSNATLQLKSVKNSEEVHNEEFNYSGGIAEYVQSMTEGGPTLHDCVHFRRQHESSEVRTSPFTCLLVRGAVVTSPDVLPRPHSPRPTAAASSTV